MDRMIYFMDWLAKQYMSPRAERYLTTCTTSTATKPPSLMALHDRDVILAPWRVVSLVRPLRLTPFAIKYAKS